MLCRNEWLPTTRLHPLTLSIAGGGPRDLSCSRSPPSEPECKLYAYKHEYTHMHTYIHTYIHETCTEICIPSCCTHQTSFPSVAIRSVQRKVTCTHKIQEFVPPCASSSVTFGRHPLYLHVNTACSHGYTLLGIAFLEVFWLAKRIQLADWLEFISHAQSGYLIGRALGLDQSYFQFLQSCFEHKLIYCIFYFRFSIPWRERTVFG